MTISIPTICLNLLLMLASFSPVPAGATSPTQGCSPQSTRVMIVIPDTLIDMRPPDPAAETEMIRRFIDARFSVLDSSVYAQFRYSDEYLRAIHDASLAQEIGQRFGVHVIIIGEGLGDITGRDGRLLISRGRVGARAIKTVDATVIGAGDGEATARDLSGVIGAKAALRNAGGILADELIVRLARHYNLCPNPRAISRANTAVVRFTAPGLPSNIDFSTILNDYIVQLKTVDVLVAGQDLEAILSNAHAGVIPVPDVAIIGTVERAEVVNLGSVHQGGLIFYLNRITLRINVPTVDTETGFILGSESDERNRQALDVVLSVGGITLANFDRTVLGKLARDMLKDSAAKITPYVIYALPEQSYFDIITIRNGDRLGRTVLKPGFTITTSFGQFTIPTTDIKSLVVGDPSRITRVDGSMFSGQLKDTSLTLSGRGTIPMSQVATVVFAIK